MKDAVETMRQELKDDATFKEIYYFSFSFGLSENQKSLRMWHDDRFVHLLQH
jgi:hypothetical protein